MRSTRFFQRSRRGTTLVEVLGALALMATVLVALLVAKARSTRQTAIATRRLEAVAAADKLLESWWAHPDRIPRRSAGAMSGAREMSWRTTRVPNMEIGRFGAEIVRVEIVDTPSSALLTSIEIVLPSTGAQ